MTETEIDAARTSWNERAARVLALKFTDLFVDPTGPCPEAAHDLDASLPDVPYAGSVTTWAVYTLLRDAIVAAGLTGKIQLHASHWPKLDGYWSAFLAFYDWDLIPAEQRLHPKFLERNPDRPHRPRGMLAYNVGLDSYSEGLWWPIVYMLRQPDHPLRKHLEQGLTKPRPDGTIPLWPAWPSMWGPTHDPDLHLRGYGLNKQYGDIRAFQPLFIPGGAAAVTEGVVVPWLLSWGPKAGVGDMEVRLDTSTARSKGGVGGRGLLAEDLALMPGGAGIFMERTHGKKPRSPTTMPRARDSSPLQVYGRGRSQQEDFVPTIDGVEAIVLFVWSDNDVTTTISVSVDDDGVPLCCWMDRSST